LQKKIEAKNVSLGWRPWPGTSDRNAKTLFSHYTSNFDVTYRKTQVRNWKKKFPSKKIFFANLQRFEQFSSCG